MEHQEEIGLALKALSDAGPECHRFRAYYRGDQDLEYATSRTQSRYGRLFTGFRENLCAPVVDATVSRLRLQSVSVVDDDAATEALQTLLYGSNLDWLSRRVHQDALTCGESFLICWEGEDGTPRLTWNRAGLVMPVYEPGSDRRLRLAVKAWLDSGEVGGQQSESAPVRVTVYYPDRAERWIGKRSAGAGMVDPKSLEPFTGDGEPAVQAHTFGRVPVVHFDAGRSDLADALPLQDALNKSGFDLLVAGEFNSLPQRWATGIDTEPDPATGKPPQFESKSMWTAAAPDAKFGQLLPGDMGSLMKVGDTWRQAIARVTRTPMHYLIPSGDFPSGEALRVAEAPFLAKLAGLQDEFGEAWERAGALLMRMPDDSAVEAVWAETSPLARSESINEALAKKTLGVGLNQILVEMGYSEDQIAAILDEKRANDEATARAFRRDVEV